jgi:hypothetical protein
MQAAHGSPHVVDNSKPRNETQSALKAVESTVVVKPSTT